MFMNFISTNMCFEDSKENVINRKMVRERDRSAGND